MCKLDVKSRYQQIKELMGERKYFETERDIFCVGDECVVQNMVRIDRYFYSIPFYRNTKI